MMASNGTVAMRKCLITSCSWLYRSQLQWVFLYPLILGGKIVARVNILEDQMFCLYRSTTEI